MCLFNPPFDFFCFVFWELGRSPRFLGPCPTDQAGLEFAIESFLCIVREGFAGTCTVPGPGVHLSSRPLPHSLGPLCIFFVYQQYLSSHLVRKCYGFDCCCAAHENDDL